MSNERFYVLKYSEMAENNIIHLVRGFRLRIVSYISVNLFTAFFGISICLWLCTLWMIFGLVCLPELAIVPCIPDVRRSHMFWPAYHYIFCSAKMQG